MSATAINKTPNVSSISTFQLTLHECCDSVESIPFAVASETDLFHNVVIGTYELTQNSPNDPVPRQSNRRGEINLFREQNSELKWICRDNNKEGVLDLKWSGSCCNNKAILGKAAANGSLIVQALDHIGSKWDEIVVTEPLSCLALSLDWNNMLQKQIESNIVMSDSNGKVRVYKMCNSELSCLVDWAAHDYEAWITAFDYFHPEIVFSGADDALFKGWDVRQPCCTFVNNTHKSGVCSIHKHPTSEFVLATGSYDENILIWDTRSFKLPLSSCSTGGGVWRLKWHPSQSNLLLGACMHNGMHVFELNSETSFLTCVCDFMNHDSMSYGADWIVSKEMAIPRENEKIVSCSFYDKAIHLWNFIRT